MPLRVPADDEPLSVILKLPGESCNINCYYCYEKRKPYEKARMLSPEILGSFLNLLDGRPLALELHGGEPLLIGRDGLRPLLAVMREYGGPIQLSLQTNGTLLNDEWLDFFNKEWPSVEIGISLDGDLSANSNRVDYSDRNIHPRVEAALRLMERHGRKVGVIAVATRQTISNPGAVIEYFRQFVCIRAIKFAPCLDYNAKLRILPRGSRESLLRLNPEGIGIPGWATTPMEYADFLIEVFDIWRRTEAYRDFLIEPLVSIIRTLAGKSTAFCHFTEMKCAYVLTLYPDGRLGSCDELAVPAALLGHVSQFTHINEVIGLQTNQDLHNDLNQLLDKCESCSYKPTCGGGCLATRLRYVGTPYDEEYCSYRMNVIDYVAAQLASSSRELDL